MLRRYLVHFPGISPPALYVFSRHFQRLTGVVRSKEHGVEEQEVKLVELNPVFPSLIKGAYLLITLNNVIQMRSTKESERRQIVFRMTAIGGWVNEHRFALGPQNVPCPQIPVNTCGGCPLPVRAIEVSLAQLSAQFPKYPSLMGTIIFNFGHLRGDAFLRPH